SRRGSAREGRAGGEALPARRHQADRGLSPYFSPRSDRPRDWDDARALAILQNCRRAMDPHAKLLIVEGVYPAHIDASLASRAAASNDMNMLVCTGGRQRSEVEFRALYAQAGFALTRIAPPMGNGGGIGGV